jgi:hypothetical protein
MQLSSFFYAKQHKQNRSTAGWRMPLPLTKIKNLLRDNKARRQTAKKNH